MAELLGFKALLAYTHIQDISRSIGRPVSHSSCEQPVDVLLSVPRLSGRQEVTISESHCLICLRRSRVTDIIMCCLMPIALLESVLYGATTAATHGPPDGSQTSENSQSIRDRVYW